jgi:O-antigen/teichoic acid export membrane protein
MNFIKTLKLDVGSKRSVEAKKNIILGAFIRGLNIVIGLLMVSLTIDYLDPVKYGIWITLSSLIAWFSFFDIGLGNGLRNKLAEALAENNIEIARTYISTTYFIISIIMLVLIMIIVPIFSFIDWNSILNVSVEIISARILKFLAIIILVFFGFNFIFKLINTILIADQKPALSSLLNLLGNILSLILVFLLLKSEESSILYLGFAISFAPALILLISTLIFFNRKYKKFRPSYKNIDLKLIPNLFSLGVKFFIIQIAAIILYQTNNIIITQLFGPENVTLFNISFKYFSVLMMLFSIIISPFWSAFTEAYTKNDYGWIKGVMNKLFKFWGVLVLLSVFMLVISNWGYSVWVGDDIIIPFEISLFIAIWMLFNTWNTIFSTFLNGVGKIKLQLYIGITAAILNVPLAILFGNNIGIKGVLLANIFVSLFGAIVYPIQYKKIIYKTAKGIWNE